MGWRYRELVRERGIVVRSDYSGEAHVQRKLMPGQGELMLRSEGWVEVRMTHRVLDASDARSEGQRRRVYGIGNVEGIELEGIRCLF